MPPWSSALAASLEDDRFAYSVAFVEARSLLMRTTAEQFPGGEAERADALAQTEHDYVALVETATANYDLQRTLERADREATDREADTAALLTIQLRELVEAVEARLPPGIDGGPEASSES